MVTLYYHVDTTRFATDRKTQEPPAVIRVAWWRDDEPQPVCMLVQPPVGATMDQAAFRYHGIELKDAVAIGKRPDHVAQLFADAATMIDAAVAFNAPFHKRNIERLTSIPTDEPFFVTQCAMEAAAPILCLPPTRGTGWKSPSLVECCNLFDVPYPLAPDDEGSADPVERGKSVIRAVRGVWEAVQRANAPEAA